MIHEVSAGAGVCRPLCGECRPLCGECRPLCGACCISLSISSPIPGMPQGKGAGVPCIHLDQEYRCRLYGKPERPAVCASLKPLPEMCGANREEALAYLDKLERQTRP